MIRTLLRALVFVAALLSIGRDALADEAITLLKTELDVIGDGGASVTERITIQAEGNAFRSGIERRFPNDTRVQFSSATLDGSPTKFSVLDVGGQQQIFAGDPETVLTPGAHEFVLRYKLPSIVAEGDSTQLLRFDLVDGWPAPVRKAVALVNFPESFNTTNFEITAKLNRTEQISDLLVKRGENNRFALALPRPLAEGDQVMIQTAMPLGTIQPPDQLEQYKKQAAMVLGPLWDKAAPYLDQFSLGKLNDPAVVDMMLYAIGAVLGYYIIAWFLVGRDPKPGMIQPLAEPPYLPDEISYISDGFCTPKTFSLMIYNLVCRGALEFNGSVVSRRSVTAATLNEREMLVASAFEPPIDVSAGRNDGLRAIYQRYTGMLKSHLPGFHRKNWIFGLIGFLGSIAAGGWFAYQAGLEVRPEVLFLMFWLSIWTPVTLLLLIGAIASILTFWRGIFRTLFCVVFAAAFTAGELAALYQVQQSGGIEIGILAAVLLTINFFAWWFLRAPTQAGRDALDKIEGHKEHLKMTYGSSLEGNSSIPQKVQPYLFATGLSKETEIEDLDETSTPGADWREQYARLNSLVGVAISSPPSD